MSDQPRGGTALLNGRPGPVAVTLDQIAANPTSAASLTPDQARALLLQSAVAQAALLSTVLVPVAPPAPPLDSAPQADRLLTPTEAARLLGVTARWLHRKSASLPFARRLSRKNLRFSEAGLRRWLAARRA